MIEKLVLGPVATNTYILQKKDGDTAIVVDPADESIILLSKLEEIRAREVTVLITHAHFDHIMGAEFMRKERNARIGLHEDDLSLLAIKGGADFFGIHGPDIREPDFLVAHGEIINLGNFNVQVIHTPGHSPGHVCYYDTREGVLFSGDLLFAGGIGRTDLPGGSYEQLMGSIRDKVLTLPEETKIFPGHGPETTLGDEIRNNPWLKGKR